MFFKCRAVNSEGVVNWQGEPRIFPAQRYARGKRRHDNGMDRISGGRLSQRWGITMDGDKNRLKLPRSGYPWVIPQQNLNLICPVNRVPGAGIEPAWPCDRGILSPLILVSLTFINLHKNP